MDGTPGHGQGPVAGTSWSQCLDVRGELLQETPGREDRAQVRPAGPRDSRNWEALGRRVAGVGLGQVQELRGRAVCSTLCGLRRRNPLLVAELSLQGWKPQSCSLQPTMQNLTGGDGGSTQRRQGPAHYSTHAHWVHESTNLLLITNKLIFRGKVIY